MMGGRGGWDDGGWGRGGMMVGGRGEIGMMVGERRWDDGGRGDGMMGARRGGWDNGGWGEWDDGGGEGGGMMGGKGRVDDRGGEEEGGTMRENGFEHTQMYLVAQAVKESRLRAGDLTPSLGREDSLGKDTAAPSSILWLPRWR